MQAIISLVKWVGGNKGGGVQTLNIEQGVFWNKMGVIIKSYRGKYFQKMQFVSPIIKYGKYVQIFKPVAIGFCSLGDLCYSG